MPVFTPCPPAGLWTCAESPPKKVLRSRRVCSIRLFAKAQQQAERELQLIEQLGFPTLYFYETGYSLHTLRQASRRSWRIGQVYPVRVKFLAYRGTMQETCIRHMGKKMLVALMMEGKFSGEGLQSLDANEDLLTAMARELVEKGGVGESADAVWRDLERERAIHAPEQPRSSELSGSIDVPVLLPAVIPAAIPAEVAVSSGPQLIHSAQPRPKRKQTPLWPTGHLAGEQMRLFG